MKKLLIILLLFIFFAQPACAMEFKAPAAPESALEYMPENQENFAQGLLYIIKTAILKLKPELADAIHVCVSVVVTVLVISIINTLSNNNNGYLRLVGAVVIGLLLLQPVNSMVNLATDTIKELSAYNKLLLPVMTAALAAQGGTTSAAALYTGTVFFDAVLTALIVRIVVPALYFYLCICVAASAVKNDMLKKIQDFLKWFMTTCLKWILYIFTGYISITGVISGTVDASALKAVKLTISGVEPVVGSVLSDASETVLVSDGVMKNAAGVYGIFAVIAVCIGPFLQIAAQYLLLKLCGAVCNVFWNKSSSGLIENFSTGMGFALAMTGTVCILLLISLVCFMKGMN